MVAINPSIFRTYDIRGVVDQTLTKESVYAIGQAYGSLVVEKGEKRIAMGRDGRLSGPVFGEALCQGLLSTGCDVIDIGIVPTPLLYYATNVLETTSGIMLTGSHNPAEYNGLKMVVLGKTLAEGEINQLYQCIVHEQYAQGHAECRELEIVERYIRHVVRDVPLARPLKIVIDCGNGVTGNIAPELFRRMNCEVHELFCEIDGRFPNHHPDPSQVENLQDLIKKVREVKADIGLAFDGDGDRLGVVTSQGEIIWPDRQLILFAKSILQHRPGGKIIYDVKCTHHLAEVIRACSGEPIMWKTGHSLIKAKLFETQALLAGEMSGHIFFKDRWYGFDDALYAAARLLQILSQQSLSSADLFSTIPNSVNTPELKIAISDQEKFLLMDKLIQQAHFFAAADILTIDGLRVNFAEGWGLVRPSNTTPCLVLRFEAQNPSFLQKIQEMFRAFLLSVEPNLMLPF